MKATEFFIKRPVLAIVVNVMMMVIGLIAFNNIELREYPKVDLPTFTIEAHYQNAGAETMEESVTRVLESALSEVEGLDTIYSVTEPGFTKIHLKMKSGTNTDKSMALIRDEISKVRNELPTQVKEPSIISSKGGSRSGLPFIAISFTSTSLNMAQLTHYVNLHIKKYIRSIKGVGTLQVWGQPYKLDVLLDPKKMYALGINSADIIKVFEDHKSSLPAGKFQERIEINLDIKPKDLKDFEELKVKDIENTPIYLKDIAKLSLKGDEQDFRIKVNGQNGVVLSISKTSEANPLTLSTDIRKELEKINNNLPEGMKAWVALDQSDFIRASIANIRNSIIESVIFVLIVVLIFLRNIRSALIPLFTIPISLIASIAVLKVFGFSMNTMTMLAMVLAIGLVVDDAIVVLENIHRHIEKGLTPLAAAIKGSKEIGFAIIAMTFTLASVYIPIMFITDTIGQIFVEFVLALSASVIISGIVALTLSPMMCAQLLKSNEHNYFEKFDEIFDNLRKKYNVFLHKFISKKAWVLSLFLFIIVIMIILYSRLPQEIAPKEDRGIVGVFVPTIPGNNLDDLEAVTSKIGDTLKTINGTEDFYVFMGDWGASFVLILKDWSQRSVSSEEIKKTMEILMKPLKSIEMHIWSIDSGLPSLDSVRIGDSGLAILTTDSYEQLYEIATNFSKKLEEKKIVKDPYVNLQIDNPQLKIDIKTVNLSHTQITPNDIATTLETFFGGIQRFQYTLDGFSYPIIIKGSNKPWSISELYITNPDQKRISLASLVDVKYRLMPKELEHINQLRSTVVSFETGKGQSIPEIIAHVDKFKKENLPANTNTVWTGMFKAYLESSGTMYWLMLMSLIFIYAILAMQFESFLDPFIIILAVPLACFGSLLGIWITNGSINIFSQIGIITLVGLITKHGILIVEFANQLLKQGKSTKEAVIESACLRLRPIIMTSTTMVIGAIPLIISHGPGSESRYEIGIVLVCGLLIGTILTLILIPSVYIIVKKD